MHVWFPILVQAHVADGPTFSGSPTGSDAIAVGGLLMLCAVITVSAFRYHLPSDPAVKPAITTFGSDATAATPAPPSLQPVPVPAAASAGNGAYAAAATAAAATAAAAYSNGNGSGNGAYSGSNGSYSGSAGNGGYGTGGNGSTEAPLVPQPVAVPVSASIGSNSGGTK
jgi:hypothetical protein